MSRVVIFHGRPKSLLIQQEHLPDILTMQGSPGAGAEIKSDDIDGAGIALLRGVIADGGWITLTAEIEDDDE